MRASTLWILAAGLALPGCEEKDIGQPCGTEPIPVSDPIGGEEPVVEVVRVQRDRNCESFQCLNHRGLTPYCTRHCEIDTPTFEQKRCNEDADCTGGEFASGQRGHCDDNQKCVCEEDDECESPLQCSGGRCRDDDCPEGYWCKTVQDVGPLAEQRFCVFADVCQRNADCEAFGVMECNFLGCFDACLRDYLSCAEESQDCVDLECYAPCPLVAPGVRYCPNGYRQSDAAAACADAGCFVSCEPLGAECEFHRLICEPLSTLNCTCQGEQTDDLQSCPNANIVCQPDTLAPPWTAGTVGKLNVCQPEDA